MNRQQRRKAAKQNTKLANDIIKSLWDQALAGLNGAATLTGPEAQQRFTAAPGALEPWVVITGLNPVPHMEALDGPVVSTDNGIACVIVFPDTLQNAMRTVGPQVGSDAGAILGRIIGIAGAVTRTDDGGVALGSSKTLPLLEVRAIAFPRITAALQADGTAAIAPQASSEDK